MKRPSLVLCALLLACQTPREAEQPPVPVVSPPPLPATAAVPNQALRLTIVGTNDVHGWVMAQKERFPRGEIRYGGVANFAAYMQVLRQDNPNGVVLVDAGDLFQGTLVSNLTEGSVVIEAFNQLGYDAAAIGNHEFDYGPVGPISAATQATMDPSARSRPASPRRSSPCCRPTSTRPTTTATGPRGCPATAASSWSATA